MNKITRNIYVVLLMYCVCMSILNGLEVYKTFINGFDYSNILNIILFLFFTYCSFLNIQVLKGKRQNKVNISINN